MTVDYYVVVYKLEKNKLDPEIAVRGQLPDNDNTRSLLFCSMTLESLALIVKVRELVVCLSIGFRLPPIIKVITTPELTTAPGLKFLIIISLLAILRFVEERVTPGAVSVKVTVERN